MRVPYEMLNESSIREGKGEFHREGKVEFHTIG